MNQNLKKSHHGRKKDEVSSSRNPWASTARTRSAHPVSNNKHGSKHYVANKSRIIEHVMYISPGVIGWISIGQDGKRLKERIANVGAELYIDSDSMRMCENKIVYITGSQKSVDAAIEMVMAQLPDGYTPEPGPRAPSSPDSVPSGDGGSPESRNDKDAWTEVAVKDCGPGPSPPDFHEAPAVNAVAPPPGFQQPMDRQHPPIERQQQPGKEAMTSNTSSMSTAPKTWASAVVSVTEDFKGLTPPSSAATNQNNTNSSQQKQAPAIDVPPSVAAASARWKRFTSGS